MHHSQRKINAELTKMMEAYEALIKAPRTNLKKWENYGKYSSCRICKLFRSNEEYPGSPGLLMVTCSSCPLSKNGIYTGCADVSTTTCADLAKAIEGALCVQNDKLFKKKKPKQWASKMNEVIFDVQVMAVERMDWLIERLDENGYQYK